MPKIVFTGGGSAGHVTLNLALIPWFIKNGWEISYIGSHNGMEKELISKFKEVKYYSITTGKLRRYFSWQNFLDMIKIPFGCIEACYLIHKINPDIIFIMHPEDNHIEHVECAHTAREAIFAAAVDGYIPNEIYSFATGPKQSMCYFEPDIYIDVEEKLDDIKRVFLNFCAENANGERLWNSERISKEYRGLECGLKYADGFKIIKYPSGSNDFLLRQAFGDKFRWAGNKMYYIGSKLFL